MRAYGKKGESQLNANNHNVFLLYYHLVLVTKYRRPWITPDIAADLEKILREVASENKTKIKEIALEKDHVHLLLSSNPNTDLAKMIKTMKGRSSYIIRGKYEYLKAEAKNFWSRSYCLLTTGGAPIDIIKKYIENQGIKKNEKKSGE